MSSDGGSKGFDKFFKPPKSTSSSNEKESKTTEKSEESSGKQSPPPTSKPSSSASNKSPPDWNLGMFTPSPSSKQGNQGGSQGRPIGGNEQNPEQNKMIFYAALGFVAFVGALTYFEMGYKEISWKDFINK